MSRPAVSVVLATRDRDYVLAHTLAHLSRGVAACRFEVEVVIVDNGSCDGTPEVLSYFANHLPLVVASEQSPGKNRALSRALELARGELTVFTDDDVIPAAHWLDQLVEATRRWDAYEIFGGRIIPRYPPGEGPALSDSDFEGWAYSRWEPQSEEGPTIQLPFGPNFAVRSSTLDGVTLDAGVGPGAGPMGSETTLLKALVARGCRIVYVPGAAVNHVVTRHQLDRRYLLRRAFGLGRGIARWDADSRSRRIAGVPRHLWREVVQSWLVGKLPLAGTEARLRAQFAHQRARGQIFEYRRLSR